MKIVINGIGIAGPTLAYWLQKSGHDVLLVEQSLQFRNTIEDKVETIFGDSIADIDEHPDGVRVSFDHAAPHDADLVVGADGLQSRVRSLAFGAEDEFEFKLAYHVAAFAIKGYRPRDETGSYRSRIDGESCPVGARLTGDMRKNQRTVA